MLPFSSEQAQEPPVTGQAEHTLDFTSHVATQSALSVDTEQACAITPEGKGRANNCGSEQVAFSE